MKKGNRGSKCKHMTYDKGRATPQLEPVTYINKIPMIYKYNFHGARGNEIYQQGLQQI